MRVLLVSYFNLHQEMQMNNFLLQIINLPKPKGRREIFFKQGRGPNVKSINMKDLIISNKLIT